MRADAELIQIVDAAVAEARRRSAGHLACRRGCLDCCIGPFAITALDALRLRRGLDELRAKDADRAARLELRAAEAAAALGDDLVLRQGDEAAEDAFHEAHGSLPCPVLDLETGACELYEHRPIACRLHGPAMRVDGVDLRHCRLNYVGLSDEAVDGLRVLVDPGVGAARAVAEGESVGVVSHRTYVAFACSPRP